MKVSESDREAFANILKQLKSDKKPTRMSKGKPLKEVDFEKDVWCWGIKVTPFPLVMRRICRREHFIMVRKSGMDSVNAITSVAAELMDLISFSDYVLDFRDNVSAKISWRRGYVMFWVRPFVESELMPLLVSRRLIYPDPLNQFKIDFLK